jgi:hypothetical protein
MKIGILFISALIFSGAVRPAAAENGPETDLLFQGVVGVKPAEAGIGDPIVVRVRDLDGWVLNEIMQRRITGEGYFTDDQFNTFLRRQMKAESEGRDSDGNPITYGDDLYNEFDAITACKGVIRMLNGPDNAGSPNGADGVIGLFKASIAVFDKDAGATVTGTATATSVRTTQDVENGRRQLDAAETQLKVARTKFADLESRWSNGVIFDFKVPVGDNAVPAPAGTSDVKTGQSSEDVDSAREGLEAAEKQLSAVESVLDSLETNWYAGWQAHQCWQALFRAVSENLYLQLNDSRLTHVKALNPFNGNEEDATETSIYKFQFDLEKDPNDKAEWDKLYEGIQRQIPATVSLGFNLGGKTYTLNTLVKSASPDEDAPQAEATAGFSQTFKFVAYREGLMAAGLSLVILALLAFLWLARDTEMVRDPSPSAGSPKFSLARCQTAFWFFLFTAAYLFLWVVKGQTDTLTEQCLVLLGISTGTTIGVAVIGKPVQSKPYGGKLPSKGFKEILNEMLSDDSGNIAFYRFQILIWTLVLGLVFIKSVYFGLKMPEFGTNELTLMGISAGTYVGFKVPGGKESTTRDATAKDAPDVAQTPAAAAATPAGDEAKPGGSQS